MGSALDFVVRLGSDVHGLASGMSKARSEIKQTETTAKQSGKGFSAAGAMMSAGLMAGAAALGAYAIKSVATYRNLGAQIAGTQRMLGGTADESSKLVGQIQLVQGVATDTGAAFGFFSKNLGLAQKGSGPAAAVFKSLGINLKDSNGQFRSGVSVIEEFRSKVSGLSNASERAATAAAVMGKGYKTLLPWLTKSGSDITALNDKLKNMGFGMNDADMAKFKSFMGDERLYAVYQEQLQFKMGELTAEIETKFMPAMLKFADVFNKIPAPVLGTVAALAGLGMAVGGVSRVLDMFGIRGVRSFGRLGRAIWGVTPFIPRFVAGFKDARVATSAFSGAAGTLGGKVRGIANGLGNAIGASGRWLKALPAWIAGNTALAASYTAIGVAAAASAFAVYEAVKAAQQMWQAENDLLAQKDANKAAEQDLEHKLAEKYGRGSVKYQQAMQMGGMGGGAGSFDSGYSHPWYWGPAWKAYDKVRGFASGGIATGPSSGYLAMLHGTEKITPMRGRNAVGSGGDIHVHIAQVVGTDERSARQFSEMVGRHLMRGTLRQMVGQNG